MARVKGDAQGLSFKIEEYICVCICFAEGKGEFRLIRNFNRKWHIRMYRSSTSKMEFIVLISVSLMIKNVEYLYMNLSVTYIFFH